MKALLICKRYYTNRDLIVDRFGRNYYFPILLQNKGIQFTVAAADYKSGEKKQYELDNVVFHSIPCGFGSLPTYLSQINKLTSSIRPDIIIASGDSHLGYLAYILARRFNIPFIFDVYDQYSSFGSNKIPGMKTIYKKALAKADHVLCASQALVKFAKCYNENVSFIPNGVDVDIFRPVKRATARKILGLNKDSIIIGYFGSMEKMRGIKTLVDACKLLQKDYPKLRLLLAGTLDKSLMIDDEWIEYRGVVPQNEIAMMINSCNVAALPYIQSSLIDYGNSCKSAEYLACEVPIITTRVANFIDNYPKTSREIHSAICEPGNPQAMRDVLRYQIENQLSVPCPKGVTWSSIVNPLFEIITALVEQSQLTKTNQHA